MREVDAIHRKSVSKQLMQRVVCFVAVIGIVASVSTNSRVRPWWWNAPGAAAKQLRFHSQFTGFPDFWEHAMTYSVPPVAAPSSCHNATGACRSTTYLCLDGTQVSAADRCDGIEDCKDGTDELLCHAPATHHSTLDFNSVLYNTSRRLASELFATATCNGCACPVGADAEVANTSPYFETALAAKMTPEFSDVAPKGVRCDEGKTSTIMIRMYKKSGYCRKAICCVRQVSCVRCNATDVTPMPGKCRLKIDPTTTTVAPS